MAVKPVPDGYHTATPYLLVENADALLDFVQRAFGARMDHVMRNPDGAVMHADFVIGDSHIMVGQASGSWKPLQGSIYLYVPDCDATYRQALDAGGTSIMPPATMFYGDRHGGVTDPCGNQWWMATHVEDVPEDELKRRHDEYAKTRSTAATADA